MAFQAKNGRGTTHGKCIRCGRPFVGQSNRRYCSWNCAARDWDKRQRDEKRAAGLVRRGSTAGTCLECGRSFTGYRTKRYCGRRCAQRAYARNHRDVYRVAAQRYRANYPDRVKQQLRRRKRPRLEGWRREQRLERARKDSRRYRERHPYRASASAARSRERNREATRFRARMWRLLNPERHAYLSARRRARVMKAGGTHTEAEWRQLIEAFGGQCAYCGRADVPLTRDHVVPLICGGTHDISNIVPACRDCNQKKGRLTAEEFLARSGGTVA